MTMVFQEAASLVNILLSVSAWFRRRAGEKTRAKKANILMMNLAMDLIPTLQDLDQILASKVFCKSAELSSIVSLRELVVTSKDRLHEIFEGIKDADTKKQAVSSKTKELHQELDHLNRRLTRLVESVGHIRTVRAELQPSLVAEQLQTSVQQPERQKKKPVRFGRPTIGSRARNPIQAPGALVESSVEESSVAERIPVEKAASSSSSSPPSPKKKYFILNPDTWELEEISERQVIRIADSNPWTNKSSFKLVNSLIRALAEVYSDAKAGRGAAVRCARVMMVALENPETSQSNEDLVTRIRNEVQDFSLLSSSLEVLVAEFRHYTRIKNFGTIASAVDATKQGEAPAESSAASEGATVDLLESLQVFPDAFLSVKAALESESEAVCAVLSNPLSFGPELSSIVQDLHGRAKQLRDFAVGTLYPVTESCHRILQRLRLARLSLTTVLVESFQAMFGRASQINNFTSGLFSILGDEMASYTLTLEKELDSATAPFPEKLSQLVSNCRTQLSIQATLGVSK